MENLPFIIASVFATALLLLIAFPQFTEIEIEKRKKVGSSYWGTYFGISTDESEAKKTIELKKPAGKLKTIIGSYMYSAGRGTSTRR